MSELGGPNPEEVARLAYQRHLAPGAHAEAIASPRVVEALTRRLRHQIQHDVRFTALGWDGAVQALSAVREWAALQEEMQPAVIDTSDLGHD